MKGCQAIRLANTLMPRYLATESLVRTSVMAQVFISSLQALRGKAKQVFTLENITLAADVRRKASLKV